MGMLIGRAPLWFEVSGSTEASAKVDRNEERIASLK